MLARSPPWSLRRRLLGTALGVALLAWLVGGTVTVLAARDVNARLRDSRLQQLAETVWAFADHELAEVRTESQGKPPTVHTEKHGAPDQRYHYQLWSAGGELVMRSPEAPDAPLVPMRGVGFHVGEHGGDHLRAFVMRPAPGGLEIQVAEVLDTQGELLSLLHPGALLAIGLSLLAVAASAGWLVVRALRPVSDVERELLARHPNDLRPLAVHEGPRELQPMLGALNRLLERTAARLSRERGFTAVAAHELRTPLAALRMQAQVASREADPARQSHQLGNLLASVDRCDHLLDQLLTLARLEHDDPALAITTLDLHTLFGELRTEMQPALERWGGTLVMEAAEPTLQGRAFGVQTLLRNLIANAIAYGPPRGQVLVRSSREGSATVLTVDDNGPGIPEADRERAFERYVRLDRRGPASAGVGLGLSIVRAVAEEHGAQVQLQDCPLGGLRVRVSFPRVSFPDKAGPAGSPARAPSGSRRT